MDIASTAFSVGRARELLETQAEEFIEKVRSEAREGRLSLPPGRKTQLSFAEAAEKYADRLEETNGKNLVAKRRQFRLYLTPFFGSQRFDFNLFLHGGPLQAP